MSSIDKRIVEMQFNNRGFESGVRTTLASLKQLNEKLKMKDAGKGLEGISNAAGKVNLNGLSSGVDTVTARFSAMGVVAATVLSNITNSAINAGKKLINSFAIEPITEGFGEYEQKMKSIATIRANTASKGVTEKQITAALNELNDYSDKTIYNFAQMTDGIGKFTAAGLGLKESVSAIKGIANLGAASGSNPQQVATMYWQMSQALAAGKVSLQDWNSVVNAGMGGELFQNELKKTAKEMGIFVDENKSFRDSISDGWLTSEVLAKTFERIGNDKNMEKAATQIKTFSDLIGNMKEVVGSGWAQTFEHLFGGSEASTKLWTGISKAFENVVGKSAEARNKMLEDWSKLGGRDDIIKGLSNVFGSLGKVFGSVGKAFREVFPPMTGKKLADLSKGFKDFTEKIKISDKTAGKIKDTFKGVFSVFKIVGQAVLGVVKSLAPLGSILGGLGKVVLTVTGGIGKFISKIAEAATKSDIFGKVADGINKAFDAIDKALSNVGKGIKDFFGSFSGFNIGDAFSGLVTGISNVFKGLSPIIKGLGEMFGSIDLSSILGVFAALAAGKGIKGIKDIFKPIGDSIESFADVLDKFKEIGGKVTDILDGVRDSLQAYQNNLNASTLLKIAAAVGILAASLAVLSTISPDKLGPALMAVTILIMEMVAATAALLKVTEGNKLKGLVKLATSLLILSTAVLVLSAAMKKMAGLEWEGIAKGLLSVGSMLAMLVVSSRLMNKESKGMFKTAVALLVLSAALNVMAGAVRSMASMSWENLAKGLLGVGMVLFELGVFVKTMGDSGKLMSTAISLTILAAALNVLSGAMRSMASMSWENLSKGLLGVGMALFELGVFVKTMGDSGKLMMTAISLTILAAALNVLSGAVRSMASMTWENMAKGLLGVAGGLTILGVASKLISGPSLLITAAALVVMSGALHLLAGALQKMAEMSWSELAVGLTGLAGALVILGVAGYAMSGCLLGAAAMLVMAGALAIMIPQLVALSQLSLQEVGTGLLALAGAFTVIGLAGLLLAPVIPAILGLAGAIALIGVGAMAAGLGMTLFATGLGAVAAVAAGAGLAIAEMLTSIASALPALGTALAQALTSFLTSLASSIPQIITAIGTLITGILTAFTTAIPQIVAAATEFVVAMANGIAQAAPQLVSAGVDMVMAILQGIADNIEKIVDKGAEIIVKFLNGVSENLGQVIQAGIDLAIKFINGVANGIRSNGAALQGAIQNLISAMITTGIRVIMGGIGGFISAGVKLIGGLVKGIGSAIGKVGQAIGKAIQAAKRAASKAGSALVSAGRSLITGFISGIKSAAGKVAAAARGVVQNAINAAKSALKINSPSKVFIKIGASVNEGFALGLTRYSDECIKPAEDMVSKAIETAKKPLGSLAKILHEDVDTTPVIAPVMDLSNVKDGAKTLSSMISDKSMSIAGVSGGISKSIGRIQNGNTNNEIVSAISDLKNSLSNLGNTTYQVNGITYDDGSNITNAVETLVRAARVERRI